MRTSIVIFSILLVGALAAPGYDECAPQDPSCQKAQPKCLSNDPSCSKPTPEYSSYTPEYSSSMPEYSSNTPDNSYSTLAPEYSKLTPEYSSNTPEYSSSTLTPEYSSNTPEYSSNTPEYSSSTLTPEYSSKLTPEYSSNEPKPCSSEFYHPNGKCGLAEHGFLRCQYGLFCSQYGFCGAEPEYERNAICPKEERFDQYPLQYRSAPNDPIDYEKSPSADPEPYAETAEVTYFEPMSTTYNEVEFYATPVPQVYVPPAVVVEEPYPSPYVQQYINDAPESSYNKANANDCPPSYAQVYRGDAPELSYKRANVYETYSSRSHKPKAKTSCWGSLFCQNSKKQEKKRKRKHRQHKQCERQSC